jgi:hypothetical protein
MVKTQSSYMKRDGQVVGDGDCIVICGGETLMNIVL